MNINIYIEDELAEKITRNARSLGKSRSAIVSEALRAWLEKQNQQSWPSSVLRFKGFSDFPALESHRKALKEPKEDPFS